LQYKNNVTANVEQGGLQSVQQSAASENMDAAEGNIPMYARNSDTATLPPYLQGKQSQEMAQSFVALIII
jgi:hypothetical protein